MNGARAAAALACAWLAGCSSRPELPGPSLPLARTPDAAFRAGPPAPDARVVGAPPVIHERKLPNGLSVVVVEHRALPLASVLAVVRRAGREGASERRGIASLTARTLLFGTRTSDGRELSRPSLLGERPMVLTTEDAATLGIETHALAVPQAIGLLAALVSRPAFGEAPFSHALNEQLDAIAASAREPVEHLRQAALERLYGNGEPLARPSLGTSAEVKTISLAQVRAFYDARYRPASTALVIVGDVVAAEVFASAERELGSWSSGTPEPPPDRAPAVVPYRGDRPIVAFTSGAPLTYLFLAVPGPGASSPDWLAFSLAGTAISGLASSRGNRALSHEDGRSYSVSSDTRVREASSEHFLSFAVASDDIEEALDTMFDVIDALGERPLAPAELERVRAWHSTLLSETFASNAEFSGLLATYYARGLPAAELATARERVAALSAADVQRAARRWFSRARVQVAAFTDPYAGGKALARVGRVDWYSLVPRVSD